MNELGKETSPYLLQHQHNPVWWKAWGESAFEQARREKKLVFLSIGYSTCHWCHVMEQESFEHKEVADVLNQNFVAIKVDREERPDVDDIYMTAVQVLTGGGGWPMSVWLTPEGKPFYAGTYFPKTNFMQICQKIVEVWSQEPQRVLDDGDKLTESLQRISRHKPGTEELEIEELLRSYIPNFEKTFDANFGGFGGAPKFPQTMNLIAMMRIDRAFGIQKARTMIEETLTSMGRGGLFDQLNGGFHRYSVDAKWVVPHFEKMLYDNALLAMTYLEAYQAYGNKDYEVVARRTLDYVLKEMTSEEGGFYSAQDADSLNPETDNKEEGYFCTFSYEELQKALSEDELDALQKYYQLSKEGNFEQRNVLVLCPEAPINPDLTIPAVKSALEKLKTLRAEKPRPHLDDKILSGWNGWMIEALTRGYELTGDQKYKDAAVKAMKFVLNEMRGRQGNLLRSFRAGEAKLSAYSDDYAAVISALLSLVRVDSNAHWLNTAIELQDQMIADYWRDPEGGFYRENNSDPLLIMRPVEDQDGVRPSGNSLGALNLLRLFQLTGELDYEKRAEQIFRAFYSQIKKYPSSLPQMVSAMVEWDHGSQQLVVLDDKGGDSRDLAQEYFPFLSVVQVASDQEYAGSLQVIRAVQKVSKTPTFYLCHEGHCEKPCETIFEIMNLIRDDYSTPVKNC